jgi:TolB-like protein
MTDQLHTPTQPSDGQPAPIDQLDGVNQLDKKRKKKKDKVRSAWISFVGRIVAQIMGAVATIALGLLVVHHYKGPKSQDVASAQETPAPAPVAQARLVTPGNTSLAVLPFETYSGEVRKDFADAMTEALIADLSRIKNLRVISRTSSMQYKAQRKALPVIAKELDVDLIIEGSVTTSGNRVRVTVQLIDAKRDEHVWADSYDRSVRDVLSVQAEIAKAVARQVNAALFENAQTPSSSGQSQRPAVRKAEPEASKPGPAASSPTSATGSTQ